MGVLDRFEKGIERAVNGAFAKAFRSEVQPVEIASALRRECDDKSAVIGRDRTIAPNAFVVALGSADHQRLGQWADALGRELSAVLTDHARQQRYSFVGPVSVTFAEADDLDTGVFRVHGVTAPADPPADPRAVPPAADQPSGHPAAGDRSARDRAAQEGAARDGAARDGAARGSAAAASAAAAGPAVPPLRPPARPAAPPAAGSRAGAQPAGRFGAGRQVKGPEAAGSEVAGSEAAWSEVRGHEGAGAGAAGAGAVGSEVAVLEVDGQPYRVVRPVVVIGRGTEADIMLDDAGVSRRHAEVHSVDGRVRIIDLGSTNGTFVDGAKVPVATLRDGSVVTIGRTRIVFRAPGPGTPDAPGAR